MTRDRIVAVGLLTEQDVAVLGRGFKRLFPLREDGSFDELLAKLDSAAGVTQSSPGKAPR